MIKVHNQKVIRELSVKSAKANKVRNYMAVATIILTTVLFTALFTMMAAEQESLQQQTFRQVGGDFHGTFKNLSEETMEKLSGDPLIAGEGKRLFLGMLLDGGFQKQHTEISYMDQGNAKGYFCSPEYGRLPAEDTMEIACDTKVLEILGIQPEIGARVPITYYMGYYPDDKVKKEAEFTLSGWWEFDDAGTSAMAIVPLSYAREALQGYEASGEAQVGTWDYNIYLRSDKKIEEKLEKILTNHGFQSQDVEKDNYISVGVNWGYSSAQFDAKADAGTVVFVVCLLAVFMFTGYLIIYNIFQISVVNDIQFYGLLKTVGMTRKQIRRMIYYQAMRMCAVGIPAGLILGYACGHLLAPLLAVELSVDEVTVSFQPWIFVASALFSLLTVLISLRRPGRIAGKVSPVEAVKYIEVNTNRKRQMKGGKKSVISHMAFSNLGRNRKKTAIVVTSLALTIVIFYLLVTFTKGMDMNKFVAQFVTSDYLVADASYFRYEWGFPKEQAVPEEDIRSLKAQDGIASDGRIYGNSQATTIHTEVDEQWFRDECELIMRMTEKETDDMVKSSMVDGRLMDSIDMYGMEALPLSKLKVIAGDISRMADSGERYILAVYGTDDYGNVDESSNWAQPGDKISVTYQIWKYYDIKTGKEIKEELDWQDESIWEKYESKPAEEWKEEYTVAAAVTVPYPMSYRRYGCAQFVMDADSFRRDVRQDSVMSYMIDMEKGKEDGLDEFLKKYTEEVNSSLDFESRAKYLNLFRDFRKMYSVIGGSLCFVVGMIGVFNFLYVMITSVMTRRHEFAMLRSVGMTLKQIRKMLIMEGIWYAVISVAVSLPLCMLASVLIKETLGSMLWFFTYHFTLLPFAVALPLFVVIGILVPVAVFYSAGKDSIVEQLRRAED